MNQPDRTIIIRLNKRFFSQLTKWLLIILAIGLIISLLVVVKHLLVACIISVFLAFLLEPLVLALENRNFKRTWAVVLVFISLAVIATF